MSSIFAKMHPSGLRRLRASNKLSRQKACNSQETAQDTTTSTGTIGRKPTSEPFPKRTKRTHTDKSKPRPESSLDRRGRTDNTDSKPKSTQMDSAEWKSTYCYDHLNHLSRQIQLVTLFPARDKSANIHCSLEIVSFPLEGREYEALSYAWGDGLNKQRLYIGEDILAITQNLEIALRHLRHPVEPRTLWIDAICINQSSDEDKTHQVRQMYDIYANAFKVLIWLGEADKDIEQAMEFLQDSRENRNRLEKPLAGLMKMFNRPWWSRMWVVQEMFAARTDPLVICGDMSASSEAVNTTLLQISWDELGRSRSDHSLKDASATLRFCLLNFRDHGQSNYREITLESLLNGTCDREASDPRDHVYALLGLVADPRWESFEPDYTKPKGVAYQNAMVNVFKSRQDLDWLVYALGENTSVTPSWCADFSLKGWQQAARDRGWEPTAAENRKSDKEGAGASVGKEKFKILHDSECGTLKVVGTEVGRIAVAKPFTCGALSAKRVAAIAESLSPDEISSALDDGVWRLSHDIGTFIIYAQPVLKRRLGSEAASRKLAAGDLWKIAAGGISFNTLMECHTGSESITDGYSLLEKFAQKTNELRKSMSHEWAHLLPEEPPDFAEVAYFAYAGISFRAGNQWFFTTNNGYIGCAGYRVQEGDVLCILFGCRHPAVLRLQEDGSYRLVTFTYTDDIMKGEFLRDNDPVEEKEFLLR